MNELLEEVLTAHGGADRWQSIAVITGQGRVSGLLPKRFAGNKLANFAFNIRLAEQHSVLHGFPQADQRAVFDRGDVRIETREGVILSERRNARDYFFGLRGIRRNIHWDPLDVAYFAGYASWNYLTFPALLAHDGVEAHEGDRWKEHGETWRRLEVSFPAGFHTHCRHQTFYVDANGLIRRHDYVAEPVGRWARASMYCDQHRQFEGLTFPTRRRVVPRGPGGRALPGPTLVAPEFDEIVTFDFYATEIERSGR